MSKSDSLKNGMKSGLDGLLSSRKVRAEERTCTGQNGKRTCRALQFCY